MKQMLLVILCVFTSIIAMMADEPVTNGFKTKLSAGLSLTDGNSQTLKVNGAFLTEGEREGLGSIRAGIEANYGESTVDDVKAKNIDNATAFANTKVTISRHVFWYVNGDVRYDDIARIDYRTTLGPGIGAYIIKNDSVTLSAEAGPSYLWERVEGVSDDYVALRFAERIDLPMSKTSKLWQSLEYLPKSDDFGHYLLSAEIGAEAAMTTIVKLRLVFQNKYNSMPGAGLKENDLSLVAGLSVSI